MDFWKATYYSESKTTNCRPKILNAQCYISLKTKVNECLPPYSHFTYATLHKTDLFWAVTSCLYLRGGGGNAERPPKPCDVVGVALRH